MEQNKPAGSGFLKVVGILMIIFGGLGLIISGIAATATIALSSMVTGVDDGGLTGMLNMMSITAVIGAILQLVTGIIGVAFSKKPEKAMVCLIFGVIVLLLNVVSSVIIPLIAQGNPVVTELNMQSVVGINWVGLLTGAVMPILFILGASKNKAA